MAPRSAEIGETGEMLNWRGLVRHWIIVGSASAERKARFEKDAHTSQEGRDIDDRMEADAAFRNVCSRPSEALHGALRPLPT